MGEWIDIQMGKDGQTDTCTAKAHRETDTQICSSLLKDSYCPF